MTSLRPVALLAALLSIVAAPPALAAAADPSTESGQAAERQYRIARRLAAEGSAAAAAALEKVVTLDPTGDLADDALVEHAILLGAAAWPEGLGGAPAESSRQAAALLERVLTQHAAGDRAVEARFLRALSRLEPATGYDPSAAKLELLDISSRAPGSLWDRRARYTRAWLDERQGQGQQALASYQRLLVDAPDSPCAERARVGQARVLLRTGDYGRAARLLQEALDRGVADPAAPALRELAVRSLLRRIGNPVATGTLETVVPSTGIRQFVGMAVFPDGGVLLAGRRAGALRFDASGAPAGSWNVDNLQAVAVDRRGVAFAAAGDRVLRLDPGGTTEPVAGLGDFSPVTALTLDGEGRFWVLDRRGEQLGSLERGAEAPVVVWRVKGQRLNAIDWVGSWIAAVDTRAKTVLSIDRDGSARPRVTALGDRPAAVSADPTGRLAVLDPRDGVVFLVGETPAPDRLLLESAGVGRAAAVTFGLDGRLHVFDAANGAWLRTP